MRLRQSTIRAYMDCPLQAKFKTVDLLPEGPKNAKTCFGTCIHFVLEDYNHHGDVDKAIALWRNVWHNPEQLDAVPDFYYPRTNHSGYLRKGEVILKEYHERQEWASRHIVATEHRFLVPFGDHELTGTVDLLEVKRGKRAWTLRIVDYKSSSKQPSSVQLRSNIQGTVYYFASTQKEFWLGNGAEFPPMPDGEMYWEKLKDAPRKLIWSALWFNKEFDAGDRNDRDFLRLHRVIDMIAKSMAAGVYVPNISAESCGTCPYQEPCLLPFPQDIEALDEAA